MATAAGISATRMATRADASLWTSVRDWFATASAVEFILYGALLLIVISLVTTWLMGWRSRRQHRRGSHERMLSLLGEAQEQAQRFEIQIQKDDGHRVYVSTLLRNVLADKLVVETLSPADDLHVDMPVEVFFRLRDEENATVYHKFVTTVLEVVAYTKQRAYVTVSMPKGLKLGQKRNFYRVKPTPRAVRVLAIWLQPQDTPKPTHTSQIGQPLYSFTNKAGLFAVDGEDAQDTVEKVTRKSRQLPPEETDAGISIPVEDISGSGMGLRIPRPDNVESVEPGLQLLCLLVYNESFTEANLVNFWCLGKVVNVREPKDDPGSLILGMEFSHWAVMEQDKRDINWFQNAPTGGVGPITQWVIKQDLEQNKRG